MTIDTFQKAVTIVRRIDDAETKKVQLTRLFEDFEVIFKSQPESLKVINEFKDRLSQSLDNDIVAFTDELSKL